ncbi:C40 family peptidase [Streptomyces meridianus]|uniref:C40 family peptidase n=1 Tax=Streptomyces meridianus TaxID=2938945 RepID=A0ABT0X0I6_9ACTN|nr:C40 family peptidase [Streptomyces meridianus]MCM2576067.1 C40 family peptidase [Streptomyces meridianus]
MSGRFVRSVCTVVLVAGAALTPPAAPAAADPSDLRTGELLDELRTLYHRAETATDAYNATHEALAREKDRVDTLGRELAATRSELAQDRLDGGRIARAQYRSGTGLSPSLQVLLSPDPARALDDSHELRRAAEARAATIRRLSSGEQRLKRLETQARKALDRRETLADRQRRLRDAIRDRLAQVERLLVSMTQEQLEAVRSLESREAENAERGFPGAQASGDDARQPSAAGREAVAYAKAQIGKPYRWGAQGPNAFDCSGLTSQAWARAGRPIPRTSQAQWRQLPRIPLQELRPGDLVVYHRNASHVALYLGDGKVVHAPRPGSRVQIAPVTVNPVLGAVRPDGDRRVPAKEEPAPEKPPADQGKPGVNEPAEGQQTPAQEGTPASPAGAPDANGPQPTEAV